MKRSHVHLRNLAGEGKCFIPQKNSTGDPSHELFSFDR
jgi:hypothetical protein